MIRAVIFDLGGVLLRTEDQAPRERLASRFGMTPAELYSLVFESESARLALLGKISAEAHWQTIQQVLGVTAADMPAVRAEFWAGDRLDTELIEDLRRFRRRYKTALLSNAWGNLRQVIERTWQIADAFDEMIISAEIGMVKPDPRIYQLAVERLGVRADEAIFVDDFIENIESAQAFGMRTIHFRERQLARQELLMLLDGKTDNMRNAERRSGF